VAQMVIAVGVDWLSLVLMTGLIFLVLGCFLDPIALLLLALPVFLPIYIAADINLIWFAIIFIKYIEIGLITPPVGVNVFGLKSVVPDIPTSTIFRGVLWFFLADVFVLALLILFPEIVLYLPSLMD
jgi:C4-dicarboxylate transporter, DctM subunit